MTHISCATTLLLAAGLCSTPAAAHRAVLAEPAVTVADIGDCDQRPDLAAREACYAQLPPEVIEGCESLRRFACAPFRDMYQARKEHSAAVDALVAAARNAYDDYGGGDEAFVADLIFQLRAADAAWAAWRDAECALEPVLDGMSRGEASGLTEACRAEKTRKRTAQLRERVSRIEEPR